MSWLDAVEELRARFERPALVGEGVSPAMTEPSSGGREQADSAPDPLPSAELDLRRANLDQERRDLDLRRQVLDARRAELDAEQAALRCERERLAGLTLDEARQQVLRDAEQEARVAAARLSRQIEESTRREADQRARLVLATAIQRLAAEQTADTVVSVVHLPGEEMKGRLIGREGRNIRTFEQVTGVNLLIDDTPATVLLSSFDPVRREAARVTLTALVEDGRIHPARIEEVHARSLRDVEARAVRAAEDACAELGIVDLHPDLLPVIGSLRYRTSYGQNVLAHSLECAHLAAMIAGELGVDPASSRRAGFLHDIGKALTHEVEGPHAEIGADLLRRHGESADIVHAVAAHHQEIEPQTVEDFIVQAADAISGSRPGARRESMEAHVQRLTRLEEIATEQAGVERAFAMQAGRELRIMVLPDQVDDAQADVMAHEVARAVEAELTFPGQVRVIVVRESRATAVAN